MWIWNERGHCIDLERENEPFRERKWRNGIGLFVAGVTERRTPVWFMKWKRKSFINTPYGYNELSLFLI